MKAHYLLLCLLLLASGCLKFDPIRNARYEIMDSRSRYFYTDYITEARRMRVFYRCRNTGP